MILHIFPDEKFVDSFINRIREMEIADNHFIINTKSDRLLYVKTAVPFCLVGSPAFKKIIGNTLNYDKVFVHYLEVSLYPWILKNRFKKLGWMVWGGDLYQLPFVKERIFEPMTSEIIKKLRLIDEERRKRILYRLKYRLIVPFVYSKIDMICTWMDPEYDFAIRNIPFLKKPSFEYFRYSLDLNWAQLREYIQPKSITANPKLILGNSGAYTNNHIDLFEKIQKYIVRASIPLSYGNTEYITVVKDYVFKNLPDYEVIEDFRPFNEYIHFLNRHDGLVIHTLRPQAMGNIWLMMYLGKPIFMNENNFAFDFLRRNGFVIYGVDKLKDFVSINAEFNPEHNRNRISEYFSGESLQRAYVYLFGKGGEIKKQRINEMYNKLRTARKFFMTIIHFSTNE